MMSLFSRGEQEASAQQQKEKEEPLAEQSQSQQEVEEEIDDMWMSIRHEHSFGESSYMGNTPREHSLSSSNGVEDQTRNKQRKNSAGDLIMYSCVLSDEIHIKFENNSPSDESHVEIDISDESVHSYLDDVNEEEGSKEDIRGLYCAESNDEGGNNLLSSGSSYSRDGIALFLDKDSSSSQESDTQINSNSELCNDLKLKTDLAEDNLLDTDSNDSQDGTSLFSDNYSTSSQDSGSMINTISVLSNVHELETDLCGDNETGDDLISVLGRQSNMETNETLSCRNVNPFRCENNLGDTGIINNDLTHLMHKLESREQEISALQENLESTSSKLTSMRNCNMIMQQKMQSHENEMKMFRKRNNEQELLISKLQNIVEEANESSYQQLDPETVLLLHNMENRMLFLQSEAQEVRVLPDDIANSNSNILKSEGSDTMAENDLYFLVKQLDRRLSSLEDHLLPLLSMVSGSSHADSEQGELVISTKNFTFNDIAVFFPTTHGNYMAFNINAPNYFLSSESKAQIGHSKYFQKELVLGRVILTEHLRVIGKTSPDGVPHPKGLAEGETYYIVNIGSIDAL